MIQSKRTPLIRGVMHMKNVRYANLRRELVPQADLRIIRISPSYHLRGQGPISVKNAH